LKDVLQHSVKLVALSGGIGSGKSVVSAILRVMGYPVIDTDSVAHELMLNDADQRQQIIKAFGAQCYFADGTPNRAYLGQVIFTDPEARAMLNGIVHPAVKRYVDQWAARFPAEQRLTFVETALLHGSGMDAMVDAVWHVTAPVQVRRQRVMRRNNLSAEQVLARIRSQAHEDEVLPGEMSIINDGVHAVLPQVIRLLNELQN